MAWGALALWERIAWAAIGIVFAWQAVYSARAIRSGPREKGESHETH
jgi:hypothetical protein